jgi:8-oxo-dGTP pyrophosphatase MutT (NUDIX family)
MADDRWRLLRQQPLARDKFIEVFENDYELPDGKRMEGYIVLREHDSVQIVALTPEREILLVRQYRVGADDFLYECPAGFLEAGETNPLERAQDELREETGYEADEWHDLGGFYPSPHRLRKTEYCFLALGARQAGDQQLDQTESVTWESMPLDAVRQMVLDGRITAAHTLALLFKAMLFLEHR